MYKLEIEFTIALRSTKWQPRTKVGPVNIRTISAVDGPHLASLYTKQEEGWWKERHSAVEDLETLA